VNEHVSGNGREGAKEGGRENIRQLFTRQLRGITSVREANERLSGATPICSGHIVKFRETNTSPARLSLSSRWTGDSHTEERGLLMGEGSGLSQNWIIHRARNDERVEIVLQSLRTEFKTQLSLNVARKLRERVCVNYLNYEI